jgi:hypothetical protein
MEYNSDFRFDLKIGNEGEELFGSLFRGTEMEVKTDFQTHRTGNFYIEYESRGKPSGIATTQAKYWCLIATKTPEKTLDDNLLYMITIETDRLKSICRGYLSSSGTTLGGDNNTSKGILIPANALMM